MVTMKITTKTTMLNIKRMNLIEIRSRMTTTSKTLIIRKIFKRYYWIRMNSNNHHL